MKIIPVESKRGLRIISGDKMQAHTHIHGPGNGHVHSHNHSSERNLLVSIVLNILITAAEVAGGLISGSLALLSDAFHNLSDVVSLFISYIAMIIARKSGNDAKTYGYKRAEILAALFNVIILLLISLFIIFVAIKRFYAPSAINAGIMLVMAALGAAINGLSALMLLKDSSKNLNIKSAFLHLLGDAVASLGVIIVALVFLFKKWYFLDSIVSILIAVYIIKESIEVLMETVNILMQGTPKGLDVNKVVARLKKEKKLCIKEVHHVHIWNISSEDVIFDAHVVVAKKCLARADEIIYKINDILACDFNISHSTIQLEGPDFVHSKECKL